MKSDPTFDRRKYLRVHTEQVVSIGRLDAREGLAHALDLSMGGIRFHCVGQDVRVAEMLKVTLTLGQVTTTVVGQVTRAVHLDEFTQEVALCFVKMDRDTRQQLEANLPPPQDASWAGERRCYSRVQLESVVSVSRANLVDVVAQARDVSLGGVRLLVDEMEIHLGDILRFVLDLGSGPLQAVGQVVRVTELDEFRQEVAIAFLDVDPEHIERLRQHLSPDSDPF